ncbi:pyruvate/2-oxoglutarate dehydrogenase complex dihydrolipoamide acyltransferase (E2) component [Bradyrhizobium sp. USDA 10063]
MAVWDDLLGGKSIGEGMGRRVLQFKIAVLRQFATAGLALLIGTGAAFSQSGNPNPQDQQKQGSADAAKDNQRKTDEFVEATQAINGPAGNPECVWLGRRVVRLMWLDDLDTAFRHLDLYDRFGCPGGHVQATFRCLTRFGATIDDKVPRSLDGRIHACWINPGAQPPAAAAAAAAPNPQASPATAGNAAPQPAASPSPSPSASPAPAAK